MVTHLLYLGPRMAWDFIRRFLANKLKAAEGKHIFFVAVQVICIDLLLFYGDWYLWFGWVAPPGVAVAILAAMAAVMSLHQDMEPPHKAMWMLIIGAFLTTELLSIGHERTEQTNKQQEALRQAQEHIAEERGRFDAIATKLNNVVTTVGVMLPQVTESNTRMSSIEFKIAAAQCNPRLIAALQAEAAKAKEDADAISKRALLSMAPGIVAEMVRWEVQWDREDNVLEQQSKAARPLRQANPQEQARLAQLAQDISKKRSDLAIAYTNQLKPLLTNASYLREGLLRGSKETEEDKKNAALFTKALSGQAIQWYEMRTLTNYMENLVKRFAPAQTPNSITVIKQP